MIDCEKFVKMNIAVQEKLPQPIQFISPLPAMVSQPSLIWSANSKQMNEGTRYRKSARKSQKRQSSNPSSCEHQITPEFQDGVGGSSMEPAQAIVRLERNIKFLKEQHVTVLSSLHKEIDELKRKIKSLQFQLVMKDVSEKTDMITVTDANLPNSDEQETEEGCSESSSSSLSDRRIDSAVRISDLRRQVTILEDENRELIAALSDVKNKNLFLSSRFEQIKRQNSGSKSHISLQHGDIPVMYSQRLDELDEMVQQQKRENVELQIELSRLKAMIREILSTSKWSSEAYTIARTILNEGHGQDRKNQRLPRIPLRPHEPQRLSSLPTISHHPPFMTTPLLRTQASLPSIPTPPPKQKNFSGLNVQMASQFNGNQQRFKSPNTQKKKQQKSSLN